MEQPIDPSDYLTELAALRGEIAEARRLIDAHARALRLASVPLLEHPARRRLSLVVGTARRRTPQRGNLRAVGN